MPFGKKSKKSRRHAMREASTVSTYSKLSPVSGHNMSALRAEVAKIYRATITERPPKHLIISDMSVTGGTSVFAGTIINQNAPFLAYLNVLGRGTTVQSRLADYCHWSKVNIKLQFLCTNALTANVRIRYMLVEDMEMRGAAITAANFGTDMFGSTIPVTNALPNINNRDVSRKYRVLAQGIVRTNALLAGDKFFQYAEINWFTKEHLRTSYVLGNAGTTADIDTGGIFIYIFCDVPAADNSITVYGEGHLYFRDQV